METDNESRSIVALVKDTSKEACLAFVSEVSRTMCAPLPYHLVSTGQIRVQGGAARLLTEPAPEQNATRSSDI